MNRDIVVAQVQAALALLGFSVFSMMRRDKTQTERPALGKVDAPWVKQINIWKHWPLMPGQQVAWSLTRS
jgi:hypothetical protein